MVDLGPTKVVSERKTERRSGGGQTEISELNPESTRRSKQRSNLQPTLVADTIAAVSALPARPLLPLRLRPLENSAELTVGARSSTDSNLVRSNGQRPPRGKLLTREKTNISNQLSDSRERATQNTEDASPDDDEEEEQLKNQRGTQRTRLAQAPIIRSVGGSRPREPPNQIYQSNGNSAKRRFA